MRRPNGLAAFFSRGSQSSSSSARGAYELVDNMAGSYATGIDEPSYRDTTDGKSPTELSVTDRHFEGDIVTGFPTDFDEPTEEERASLRKVSDNIPWSAFLVAVVEICERFTYYGLTGVLQNYVQRPANDPSGLPGALGMGQTAATGLVSFLTFWAYVTPIPGAIIADQYLGRYWTIFYSSLVYVAGVFILFLTALPSSIEHGSAFGGLVTSIIIIGIGTGGIKSNVSPLIAEQYNRVRPYVKTLKSGERVIVDPTVTIQRIYMVFYACINIGSLSPIATVYLEKYVGFWSAFLLCAMVFVVGAIVLTIFRHKYVSQPPKGSVIPNAFKVCLIAIKHHGNLSAAKPGARQQSGRSAVPWDDQFVDEVGRALVACSIFLYMPIYWLTYHQMLNNFLSQAAQMNLHGIPNDLMQNIDPITILIFIPIVDRLVYPALRRVGIPFKPITRIFFGFIFGAGAMAYAAGVQKLIYSTGPCYDAPLNCDAAIQADGTVLPNDVHVAIQTPAYLLIGLSEIFASITGLEYAFTKAPASMKSFIMSLFLFTTAIGAAFGAALAPVAVDPKLLWLYTGLAIAALTAGLLFWFSFRKYNAFEESMNELEQRGDRAVFVGEADLPASVDRPEGSRVSAEKV